MSEYNPVNVFLDRPKKVMKFLGVWLPQKDEKTWQKFYRAFMVSLQYLFLIFQIIYIIQVWGDLESVSQASYLLFTQACLCFKVTVFLVNKGMLRDLLEQMNSETLKPESLEHESILNIQATRIKRLLLAFMISSQATCGLWALKPLFDDAGNREFPFRMWLPLNPERSPQYELGYAFQLTTICMSAYMYFGIDSVALSMVIFGCGQLQVIKNKMLQIKGITIEERRTPALGHILKENYKTFVNCIVRHQAIDRFTKKIEDTYHTYLLFQLSGSVGLICMSALRILVVDWRSMQFASIVTYLLVMIMQMYVCCWCGDELTVTSEELFTSLNECQWYEQDVTFKRMLAFTMLRMSRPMVFRAGHYVPLSRQTFVAMLRMSYSYFAVLRQTK